MVLEMGIVLINERNVSKKTNDGREVKNDRYLKTNKKRMSPSLDFIFPANVYAFNYL